MIKALPARSRVALIVGSVFFASSPAPRAWAAPAEGPAAVEQKDEGKPKDKDKKPVPEGWHYLLGLRP